MFTIRLHTDYIRVYDICCQAQSINNTNRTPIFVLINDS